MSGFAVLLWGVAFGICAEVGMFDVPWSPKGAAAHRDLPATISRSGGR